MKCIILAGGKGSRIRYYEDDYPKPLIKIGAHPIIWHIIKIYVSYGIKDFIICLGYKSNYFIKYFNGLSIEEEFGNDVHIKLVDTGEDTLTGSRIKRVSYLLNKNEPFLVTYGDGVAKINIKDLIEYHNKNNKDATVSVIPYTDRFGIIESNEDTAISFNEKKTYDNKWINIGFMILNYSTLEKIRYNNSILEEDLLKEVCNEGRLSIYKKVDFWKCMDTPRDLQELNELINTNNAKWIIW